MFEIEVLYNRINPFKRWREKEWWFGYCFDQSAMFYIGWSIFRAYYADQFAILLADLKAHRHISLRRTLLLDDQSVYEQMPSLSAKRRDIRFSYGPDVEGSRLLVEADDLDVDILLRPSPADPFVRSENQFINHYRVLHTMKNPASVRLESSLGAFNFETACTYLDHCSGRVPRKTSWHWVAVQNSSFALVVLTNYGSRPQRYAHCLHHGRWVRLDQNVTFDCSRQVSDGRWLVTSADLDAVIEVLEKHVSLANFPRLIPIVTKVNHTEFVVRSSGSVRIDGQWIAFKELYGVMEAHHGFW